MPQDQQDRTIVNTDQLVDVDEATRRRAAGALFLDVRRRDKGGPVPPVDGAVVLDKARAAELLDPSSPELLPELEDAQDTEIVVFCNSEFGSDPVVGKLNEFGYRRVSHIDGGYRAWEATLRQG
ncbi:rhodanese-like domain-containing protein [Mycolicibacterium sp.]|uniref:rhodanese-like domain-containing protein n=1 Tax=Mycolicibacterium sp. TaxID=2320850 RepID=UPI003D0CDA0C